MMVEIIVATSIIAVSVLACLIVAQKSISLSIRAVHTTEAAYLLEEGAESVKIFRDSNTWANFVTLFNTSSVYCMAGTVPNWATALPTTSPCTEVGIFTRTINVANVNRDATTGDIVSSGGALDSGTKLFTVTVGWLEGGSQITKTLKFYVTNLFP